MARNMVRCAGQQNCGCLRRQPPSAAPDLTGVGSAGTLVKGQQKLHSQHEGEPGQRNNEPPIVPHDPTIFAPASPRVDLDQASAGVVCNGSSISPSDGWATKADCHGIDIIAEASAPCWNTSRPMLRTSVAVLSVIATSARSMRILRSSSIAE
jgi:hypothetical protein